MITLSVRVTFTWRIFRLKWIQSGQVFRFQKKKELHCVVNSSLSKPCHNYIAVGYINFVFHYTLSWVKSFYKLHVFRSNFTNSIHVLFNLPFFLCGPSTHRARLLLRGFELGHPHSWYVPGLLSHMCKIWSSFMCQFLLSLMCKLSLTFLTLFWTGPNRLGIIQLELITDNSAWVVGPESAHQRNCYRQCNHLLQNHQLVLYLISSLSFHCVCFHPINSFGF